MKPKQKIKSTMALIIINKALSVVRSVRSDEAVSDRQISIVDTLCFNGNLHEKALI